MQSPFLPLFKRLLQALCCIVITAACWAAADYLIDQYRTVRSWQITADALSGLSTGLDRLRQVEVDALAARANAMRDQPLALLDQRIALLERAVRAEPAPLALQLTRPDAFIEQTGKYYGEQLRHEARLQELAYLRTLRASALALLDRKAANARLEALRQHHLLVYEQYQQMKRTRQRFGWMDTTLMDQGWPRTDALRAFDTAYRRQLAASNAAADAYRTQYDAIARMGAIRQIPTFTADQAAFAGITAAVLQEADGKRQAAAGHWLHAVIQPVVDLLPSAALALGGVLAAQLAIKAMFYFVLAPLASRCKPISLGSADGQVRTRGMHGARGVEPVSRVSQKIVLNSDETLLVLPPFIQSVPVSARIDTKWLLDWSAPWTSLVAGLYGLSRISASAGDEIEISSTASATSELALLDIPPGSAMVFKPSALVGVVYPRNNPLKIVSHWRLGSVHAWLTLQLRFLEFHGPVTLIVRGTRGVRIAQAGSGRLISEAATLGFSSNVAYGTRRAEPFLPYCLGTTALLSDRFDGPAGYYVYDETPGTQGKSGTVTRWISGWAETVLRIFGI